MSIRNICICTETERQYRPFSACPAHNAAKEPADDNARRLAWFTTEELQAEIDRRGGSR